MSQYGTLTDDQVRRFLKKELLFLTSELDVLGVLYDQGFRSERFGIVAKIEDNKPFLKVSVGHPYFGKTIEECKQMGVEGVVKASMQEQTQLVWKLEMDPLVLVAGRKPTLPHVRQALQDLRAESLARHYMSLEHLRMEAALNPHRELTLARQWVKTSAGVDQVQQQAITVLKSRDSNRWLYNDVQQYHRNVAKEYYLTFRREDHHLSMRERADRLKSKGVSVAQEFGVIANYLVNHQLGRPLIVENQQLLEGLSARDRSKELQSIVLLRDLAYRYVSPAKREQFYNNLATYYREYKPTRPLSYAEEQALCTKAMRAVNTFIEGVVEGSKEYAKQFVVVRTQRGQVRTEEAENLHTLARQYGFEVCALQPNRDKVFYELIVEGRRKAHISISKEDPFKYYDILNRHGGGVGGDPTRNPKAFTNYYRAYAPVSEPVCSQVAEPQPVVQATPSKGTRVRPQLGLALGGHFGPVDSSGGLSR